MGGPAAVHEWDSATKEKIIPEKKDGPPMTKLWLRGDANHAGAIKDTSHPVIRAAERKGISTEQEAAHEAKSGNPHIRARGALGLRFIRHEI